MWREVPLQEVINSQAEAPQDKTLRWREKKSGKITSEWQVTELQQLQMVELHHCPHSPGTEGASPSKREPAPAPNFWVIFSFQAHDPTM